MNQDQWAEYDGLIAGLAFASSERWHDENQYTEYQVRLRRIDGYLWERIPDTRATVVEWPRGVFKILGIGFGAVVITSLSPMVGVVGEDLQGMRKDTMQKAAEIVVRHIEKRDRWKKRDYP